ncbi:putative callose synthase 6 [Glycine max]|nr:putative callose synthase 6 [Glycine max]
METLASSTIHSNHNICCAFWVVEEEKKIEEETINLVALVVAVVAGPWPAPVAQMILLGLVRLMQEGDDLDIGDVPSSLASLVPIVIAALQIEEENPRVAYLCRFYALEKAHVMDPLSAGRGVRRFKTYLLQKLEKENELTVRSIERSDPWELQTYYQQFYEKKIRDGEFSQRPEEITNNVQIATVLYEALKTIVPPQKIEAKTRRYAEDVERKRGLYEHYNILPLYAVGVKPAIMELPEIKEAFIALRRVDNLPMPIIRARPDTFHDDSTMPTDRLKKVNDILDWIASVFGFQKGNVANQREHLILLLANMNIRDWAESSYQMCHEVYNILAKNLARVTGSTDLVEGRDDEHFLREVVTPIYQVLMKEAKRNNKGKASHSNWRNYDDLNEYFWHSNETQTRHWGRHSQVSTEDGKRKPKTNFVEVRTFLHLYRSFDRMWIFLILALQAMIIVAWSSLGPLGVFFDVDLLRNAMTIFITYAFLNFLRVTLDIILTWNALKNMKFTQLLRYFLKFVVAAVWAVVLPVCYSSSQVNPPGLLRFVTSWAGDWGNQSLYTYVVVLFMLPNIVAAILFFLPPLRRKLERSNMRILTFLMWWAQVYPLLDHAANQQASIQLLCGGQTHNICVVFAIWAPIILVYFMDTQIWYAIYATLLGFIVGAFSHLGEIRTVEMLHSRFQSVPGAFSLRFWTGKDRKTKQVELAETYERNNISYFSQFWNEFINSMRVEDLISDRDRDFLLIPYSSTEVSVIQWPVFLLTSKIPIAVDMAKDYKKKTDDDLYKKIRSDGYMFSAVIECYETLKDIILKLLLDEEDRQAVSSICTKVERCIREETFVKEFKMSGLPSLIEKSEKLLTLLQSDDGKLDSKIANALQDIVEIVIHDVMINGHFFLQKSQQHHVKRGEQFVNINTSFTHNKSVTRKVIRLHLLLTVKESATNVPQNLEARRRITFFANSLFMNMPKAPKVRDMLSVSILTPYFKEDIQYSDEEINKENEEGISILFYLTKIYPDEWSNFHERLKSEEVLEENKEELIRQWASYRGQTLYRTVRGMMYYRQAMILQCFIESAADIALSEGYSETNKKLLEEAQTMADLKFTYVVSCQAYGYQRKSKNARDKNCYINILKLMLTHSSLRVAYIDEIEEKTEDGKSQMVYFSVLIKGGKKYDEEEIYRIKLPGPPTQIGEGKAENQNHAIIFTRGEALQIRDMNQDNYFEESFKMRNVLEEFRKGHEQQKPTILGIREHIFTGSVSSLAWFVSNQKTSYSTIGQRTLANPLRVRFHYGHPDIFDRIFHITRGGISKASKIINLSNDIFAGFNSTLRQGFITHNEYIQVGKGHDTGMNQISLFEAKVACENGEQTLSRDVYRLGQRFDFYRMMSFYFTTVGFYFSSMVTVLIVYAFLYGRLYMVLSGVEREILQSLNIHQSKALEEAMATQSVVQLGLLLLLPMVMEIGLERGFRTAVADFIIMQLQLASVFFTFQLGTKAHYYGRTLLHGGSKYRPTGRGFIVFHVKFADNYRMYSRSHFVKGLEILLLLIVYELYGESYRSSHLYLFIIISIWFLATSWLFAPFLFNPSGFDLLKTVDDWTDWKRWMGYPDGIGISSDRSWESWWDEQNEHLKYSNLRGKIIEIILAFRFFMYQYGIVYHMDITHHNKDLLVFGLSWLILIIILTVLKIVSIERQRFGTDFQLTIRILKALLFLAFLSVMTVLFVVCGLTISDLFAAIIAFMPSGWGIIQIAQVCKVCFKGAKLWDSVKELSRTYEYVMGSIIFLPIVILSWFPYVSEFQTRLLFNQGFCRGLQISMILAGRKDTYKSD